MSRVYRRDKGHYIDNSDKEIEPFLRLVAGSWSCVICPGAGGRRGQPGLLPGQPVDALAGILPRKNAGQLTPVRTVVVDRVEPLQPVALLIEPPILIEPRSGHTVTSR